MKLCHICTLGLLVCALSGAWAQDSSTPPATGAEGSPAQQPTPAYGQENAPPPVSENPPLSGLDLPSLEPHTQPVSSLQPGATLSESADSNAGNNLGTQSFTDISRLLGSLALKRLWSHYDLRLDYIGGVGYYDLAKQGFKNLQQMDIDQKITWKRGELSLRDSFSYLPEGNFGGAYGSLGSQGVQSLGTTAFGSFWTGSAFGSLGLAPRMLNVSLADVSESLTPKSTVTAAGGYAFTHFYGSESGVSFIGSSQFSGQVGYNRLLSSKTQVALVYGYQAFDFNVLGTAFHSNIIQLMYGHRITGRMDFLIGAGPQFTNISIDSIPDFRIGVAGRARLRYKFTKASMDLTYERFETSGSGFFAGAQTDLARLSADRPLSRVWSAFTDLGYSRHSRLQSASAGVDANSYKYGFAGGGLHRAFGREFHGFATYQFNELYFDRSYCAAGASACSRIGNRQVITLGLDWTPRPIRID